MKVFIRKLIRPFIAIVCVLMLTCLASAAPDTTSIRAQIVGMPLGTRIELRLKDKQKLRGAMSEDYAIVTRAFDPATEQTVISAAGIKSYGSFAASEFVTQPEYVGAALQSAPKDWHHRNVQFVLGTRIIDGTPGPPRVLAAHFW